MLTERSSLLVDFALPAQQPQSELTSVPSHSYKAIVTMVSMGGGKG